MLESIFNRVGELSVVNLLLCSVTSIVLGLIIAFVHMKTSKYSKNFLITLAVLPILVEMVILMVNGNLGTSVAIVGAFSLVRFRSIPGTSKEILSVFFAMAVGLSTGMGELVFASISTIVICIFLFALDKVNLGNQKNVRILKVSLPENLDYTNIFDDIFKNYLNKFQLDNVKTTNMGSLFELTYTVEMDLSKSEKAFLDELRTRNGNLKIMLSHPLNDNDL